MIKGVHTMFYSSEPEALRAFLRDKLGFSNFAATSVAAGSSSICRRRTWACTRRTKRGEHGQPAGTHDISRSTARTFRPPSWS